MASELAIDSSSALADGFHHFNISKPIENDTSREHPKFSTYCRKFCPSSADNGVKRLQEKRRQEMLENIKRKREKILDSFRPIIGDLSNTERNGNVTKGGPSNDDIPMAEAKAVDRNDKSDAMQVDDRVTGKARRNRFIRNRNWRMKNDNEFQKLISKQLMLSEWLVDVPDNFYTDWYMVFCPRGRRTIVIAANGQTRIYSRTGNFMLQFQSLLPGGCQNSSNKNSILDCIYVEEEHTFYVLDLISWNGCTFLDCETEFRFFWLQSRFAEEFPSSVTQPLLKKVSPASADSPHCDVEMKAEETRGHCPPQFTKQQQNGTCKPNTKSSPNKQHPVSKLYNFVPLSYQECTVDNIAKKANGPYQFNTKIDGVLFFHKRAPYTPGITPLVCWLKVAMIPDVLQISLG